MILINLLPYHLRPLKRSPLPHILSIAVLIAVVAGIGLVYLSMLARISGTNRELVATEAKLAALKDTVEEFNELNELKQSLQDRILIIQDITNDRIIWSDQLHKLGRLTPKNIWYSRIRVTSKRDQREVIKRDPETGKEVLDKKTNQPVMERQTFIRPLLEVSGYIIPNEQGVAGLYDLARNTEEDPEFSSRFRLVSPQLEDTEFEGYAVRGFKLEYEILPQGEPADV